MTFSIEGTVQAGMGLAKENFDVQLPLLAAQFPEVAGCHHGTINVLLVVPLLVLSPDFRSTPLQWHDDIPEGEVVDLLRIGLEVPAGGMATAAWLYIPHLTPHRQNLRLHEVIAPRIACKPGDKCRIVISRSAVQLPYRHWPLVTVL